MKTKQSLSAPVLALLFITLVFVGCKKETELFEAPPLSDYLPALPGKFITYRTDSTVFTSFGTIAVVRSYQEKHLVDAAVTDNEGRTAFRVYRSLRNADGTGPWKPAGTYSIIPGSATIEVVENNLRFLKLAGPVKQGNIWKGNRFLPDNAFGATYAFSNDDNMAEWDYTYTNIGESLDLNGTTVPDVLTVQQVDESANAPVTQPGAYGYINYAVNKFAKGIGLVYEEMEMWEYQPNTGGNSGYRTGFGLKRSMIDHN